MTSGAPAPWPWVREQQRTEAGLRLVGRALLEGTAAGAALGAGVVLVPGLVALVAVPGPEPAADLGYVVLAGAVAAAVGTGLGLAGAVLALVVLGVVARLDPDGWTKRRLAWVVPAGAVATATAGLGLATGVGWFLGAAPLAGAVTAWRGRRAVARHRREAGGPG